jgi:hypothetical protein
MIAVLAAAVITAKPVYLFDMLPHSAAAVDQRTVKALPGGLQQFDLVAIFAEGTPFRGQVMHVSATPYTIDCARSRFSHGATTFKALDGRVLVVDTPDGQADRWAAIPVRSVLNQIKAWVCDGTPPSDPRAGPMEDLRQAEWAYFTALGRPEVMRGQ